MYSAGKAALEREHAKPSLDNLEKATVELQQLKAALEKAGSLSQNGEWLTRVASTTRHAIDEYAGLKKDFTAKLEALEKAQTNEVRLGLIELMQKSNEVDAGFNEVKAALSQILAFVMQKSSNAQKEAVVLDKLNALLP